MSQAVDMAPRAGIFLNILIAFAIFAFGLGIAMGIAGYFSARSLSLDLLARRSELLLSALLQAEKHELSGKEIPLDAGDLIASLNLEFLAGKQVDASMTRLPDGIHLADNGNSYVFIKHVDGVPYVITGSISAKQIIQHNIISMFVVCGIAGLAAAILLSMFLAGIVSRPMRILVKNLADADPGRPVRLSPTLTGRHDEIGLLATAIENYKDDAAAHIEREKLFVSAASHELRTPLTVLSQGLEILEARLEPDHKMTPLIARLQGTTEDMRKLVENLLAMARGEKQALESLDLDAVLRNILEYYCPEARWVFRNTDSGLPDRMPLSNGVMLNINGTAPRILGSRELATFVFRNLLENAMRHSNGRDVKIRFAENFFEIINCCRFEAEKSGKSGFGLLIVQHACERMGWRLERADDKEETHFNVLFSRDKASS